MELSRAARDLQQALSGYQASGNVSRLAERLPGLLAAACEDRFVQSYLHDTLSALQDSLPGAPPDTDRQQHLVHVALERLRHLPNWNERDNQTIQAIRAGDIAPDQIKPFVRHPASWYDAVYAAENDKCRRFMAENLPRIRHNNRNNKHQWAVPLIHAGTRESTQHWVRKKLAVTAMEIVLPMLQMVLPEDTWTWIDVGCGAGRLVNAVDMGHGRLPRWRIVGCDLQADRIEKARLMAARNREYYAARIEELVAGQAPFAVKAPGVVSMFEFIEHLEDPLRFLVGLREIGAHSVIIGTPLAQKLGCADDHEPDPIHLWGFSRQAVERLFALAGFEIVMSNEARIGSHMRGLDWLTVFGTRPAIRQAIQSEARA